jgi:hypothetical protein
MLFSGFSKRWKDVSRMVCMGSLHPEVGPHPCQASMDDDKRLPLNMTFALPNVIPQILLQSLIYDCDVS